MSENAKIEPKAWAGKLPVYCSFDKLVPVLELHGNPKNPNTHDKRQLQALAKVIETNGWRDRITVSKQSGFIVKGHGRWEAAKLLKCELVPVDYQDYESPAQEYADMVADNRLAELSEMDKDALGAIFREIDLEGYKPEATGFTEAEFQDIAGILAAALEEEEKADVLPDEPPYCDSH